MARITEGKYLISKVIAFLVVINRLVYQYVRPDTSRTVFAEFRRKKKGNTGPAKTRRRTIR